MKNKCFRPLTGNLYSKLSSTRFLRFFLCVSVPSRGIYIPNKRYRLTDYCYIRFPSPHGEFIFQIFATCSSNRRAKGFRPLTGNLYSKLCLWMTQSAVIRVSVPSRGIYIPNYSVQAEGHGILVSVPSRGIYIPNPLPHIPLCQRL